MTLRLRTDCPIKYDGVKYPIGDGVALTSMAHPGWPESKTVLAHGCFDLLHLGHIRHLQEARQLGDRLVVSVTGDQYVRKGAGRPVFTAAQRVEALRALDCVDEVVINEAPDAVGIIAQVKPAVFVKGADYADTVNETLKREISAVEEAGGRFYVTRSDNRFSSSRIINGERLGDEVSAYLESARTRGFLDRILAAFERADKLKIAFVGETIIDEYEYVTPLGKPVKECCLATVSTREPEMFEGGAIAASLHADWPNVVRVTSEQEICKTRYVDVAFNRKLFEVYSDREIELTSAQRALLQIEVQEAVRESDVVVVLDFGHGLLGQAEREMVASSRFLAVNAQTNTGNFGFNPVTRYVRADYVCVDEPEARLATGMQGDPLPDVVRQLSNTMHCQSMIVTNGRAGCVSCFRHGFPVHVPAFAHNGIDTMGAGDAFLAVTAPLIAAGLDLEAAAMVGNVAGAIKVGIIGHRRHVGRDELLQSVEALLK